MLTARGWPREALWINAIASSENRVGRRALERVRPHGGRNHRHPLSLQARCASGPPVPIGRPIANIGIHLLDANLEPVPVGVPDEFFIDGVDVGPGYLNQPDASAARFIADPFADDSGELLYRTGDLARYLPDGNIEYLGRLDDQVEIRGVRIEPREVKAALEKHPGIRENVVVAGNDGRGNTRLVAHVVAAGEPAPTTAELRRFLVVWLPAAMLPAVFCVTEALPRTSSGKVNRGALAAAGEAVSVPQPAFVAPRTPVDWLTSGVRCSVRNGLASTTTSLHWVAARPIAWRSRCGRTRPAYR